MPERLPNIPFRLHTEPRADDGFIVCEIEGTEWISRPYRFDLMAVWEGTVALPELPRVGQPAALTIADSESADTAPRQIHGILSRVAHVGTAYHRQGCWFSVRLVPRLWALKRTRRRRIFQDMTVIQIVDAVLGARNVLHRWVLASAPPQLAYVVQYDESDFDFVHRMLARFGLFYFFDQPRGDAVDVAGGETMVLCDRAQQYAAVSRGDSSTPLALKLADREDTLRSWECIGKFACTQSTAPTKVHQRDWDMRTPALFGDASASSTETPALGSDLVIEEFASWNANDSIRYSQQSARTSLDQDRIEWSTAHGASDCVRMAAGHKFVLDNHELSQLNIAWVATKVVHHGRVAEWARDRRVKDMPPGYANEFDATPATMPVRIPQRARTPRQVVETAVVVGPSGEEIHCDEYGRVKVQFLWDLEGQWNDHSSCWVRVTQPWAGAGWGFQFIPRIGMEVIVSFLAGDPEHPIIIGCAYNGASQPPLTLPTNQARSTIRTRSTPQDAKLDGREGFNELRFDDTANEEQILMHAEKDLLVAVRNDHDISVGARQSTVVAGEQLLHVGLEQRETIGRHRTISVAGDETLRVGASRHVHVAGAESVVALGGRTTETLTFESHVVRGRHLHHVAAPGSHVSAAQGHIDASRPASEDSATSDPQSDMLETYVVDGPRYKHVAGHETVDVGGRVSHVAQDDGLTVGGAYSVVAAHAASVLATSGGIELAAGLTLHQDPPGAQLHLGADGLSVTPGECSLQRQDKCVVMNDEALDIGARAGIVALYLGDDGKDWGLTLTDSGQTAKMRAKNGGSIELKDTVTIVATKNLILKSTGGAKITLTDGGEVHIEGSAIKLKKS